MSMSLITQVEISENWCTVSKSHLWLFLPERSEVQPCQRHSLINLVVISAIQTILRVAIVHFVNICCGLFTDIRYTSSVPRPRGSDGVYFSDVYGAVAKLFCVFMYAYRITCMLVCTLNTRVQTESVGSYKSFFVFVWLYFADVIKELYVHTYTSLVYVSCNRIFWSLLRRIQKWTS